MSFKLVHMPVLAAALLMTAAASGQEPPLPPAPTASPEGSDDDFLAPTGPSFVPGQPGPVYQQPAGGSPGYRPAPGQADYPGEYGVEPHNDYGNCDSCCDSCCSDCCQAPVDPFIYTRYDMMFLVRDEADSQDFTSLDVNGPRVLATDDLDFDHEVVSRFLLGIPLSECSVMEMSYFGLQNWESSAFALAPDVTNPTLRSVYTAFGTNAVAGLIDPNAQETITYSSDIHNVEVNFAHRRPTCHCNKEVWWLGGIRYVNIGEDFHYLTEGDGAFAETDTGIRTDNDLIGFQLGLRTTRRVGCKLRVEAEGKVGVYANLTEQQTAIATDAVGTQFDTVRDDQIALVTDLGVQFSYDVCCWLTLRAGYHVLYVNGVALAPENVQNDLVLNLNQGLTQPDRLNANGDILYHGATAGLECRW